MYCVHICFPAFSLSLSAHLTLALTQLQMTNDVTIFPRRSFSVLYIVFLSLPPSPLCHYYSPVLPRVLFLQLDPCAHDFFFFLFLCRTEKITKDHPSHPPLSFCYSHTHEHPSDNLLSQSLWHHRLPFSSPVSLFLFGFLGEQVSCPPGDAICRYHNLLFTIT